MRFENPKQQPAAFNKIGEGTQKQAYHDKEHDPSSVTLEFKWPWRNEEIKAMFYIQKIAHILFPDETVGVKQVGSTTDEQGMITNFARTDYVPHDQDKTHQHMQKLLEASDVDPETYDANWEILEKFYDESLKDAHVQAWHRTYRKAGLENRLAPLGRQDRIDDGSGNFKFIDIAVPWDIDEENPNHKELLFDPKKLKRAIAALPEAERHHAEAYYARLLELCRSVGFAV